MAQEFGRAVMSALADEDHVTRSEVAILRAVVALESAAEYNSAEERARATFSLAGSSPRSRWLSAELLIKLDRLEGKTAPQWVVDVYEGRLPA